MNIHFDFNIGDKVRLTKAVDFENRQLPSPIYDKISENVYMIGKIGFQVSNNGNITVYYRLDEPTFNHYLIYNNKLTADYIEAVEEAHPFDKEIRFISHDNKEISLNDKVYWNLYRSNNEISTMNFVFAGFGNVVGFQYSIEDGSIHPHYEVLTKREFLCTQPNGNPWGDARRCGTILPHFANCISYGVDDDFIKKYAKMYKHEHKYYISEYSKYVIEQWLKHLGIYDKVMELYKKSKKTDTPKKATKTKKDHTVKELKELLSTMTERDLIKLKEML